MKRPALVAVATVSLAVGLAGACGKNKRTYVAELIELDATVERQSGSARWATAAVGDDFALGDAVRTGSSSRARLRFSHGGVLNMDPDTVVRFQSSPEKAVSLEIETGAVEIESMDDAFAIDTSFGVAILERSGSVRMTAEDGELKLEVLVGTVIIDSEGETTTLEAGQEITIDLGGAIIEDDPPEKVATKPPPPDAGAASVEPAVGDTIAATVGGKGNKILTKSGWKKLDKGEAQLAVGSRVRVGKRGTLEVVRGDERAVVRGSAEVVVGGADGALLEAASGAMTVTATTQNVAIKVPGGVIIVRATPGGTVAGIDVARRGQDTVVTARRGKVHIESRRGKETLRTGETADVSKRGDLLVSGRAPARVDFSFRAGESPVVHDVDAPTAIRVKFEGVCTGQGVVEISRRGSFKRPAFVSAGTGGANVVVARGSHRYRVRCMTGSGPAKKASASGKIKIQKDSGRRRLPKIAPHNVLDADGRKYRVLYQNLLPELTFVWPQAPTGGSYTLHIAPKRGSELTVESSKPRARVASGKLLEGTYTWWFEGGGESSRKTPLILDFDNAAATAYLKRPQVGENGTIHVEGAVIEGWSVFAGGRDLSLDRHRRFKADLAPSGDEQALAIRIAHPKRGVHYYLVRAPKQ